MRKQIRSKEAAARFQQEAQGLWEEMDRWMEEHPEATLKEIEQHLRPLRRRFTAQLVALQLLKRGAGVTVDPPVCPHCGQPMEYKGVVEKPATSLELEGPLPSAYYYCSRCAEGFFPPEPAAGIDEEWLE
jgi:hypothetical protein